MIKHIAAVKSNMRVILLVVCLLLVHRVLSQYYSLGQDPASVKWKNIKTEHFKIIYPDEFEAKAQNLSNWMEYVWDKGASSLSCKPKRTTIIIHNRTIVPNAFSVWAPRRMEFFTCPAQNTYSQDWLKQLAIHEYRHVVQMYKLNQGFTKGLNYLLGEQATAVVLGLYLPIWFMEGDAVCTETALSSSGRGRLAGFEAEIRAKTLEKDICSYDKAVFGSFKDFVPDQYITGYHIVAYGRNKYGSQLWDNALSSIAKYPFIITPFKRGIKKITGLSKTGLYNETFNSLKTLWIKQQEQIKYSAFENITSGLNKYYYSYKFPAIIDDSLVFAEKSGIDDICRFVIINKKTKEEESIYTPGLYNTDNVSVSSNFNTNTNKNKPGYLTADNITYSSGKLVWAEKNIDIRWEHRSYSVIKILELKTRKVKQLTYKSRYFSPAINHAGTRILAVRVSNANKSSLVLIDAFDGKEIKEILCSDNDFYLTPAWSEDDESLVVIVLNEKGKSIVIVDIKSNKHKIIIPATYSDISFPTLNNKYVFYNATYSGIDNIYAFDTTASRIYQLTSSKYGANNINYSKKTNTFVYTDYSVLGLGIAEANYKPENWKPLDEVKDNSIKLYETYIKQEQGNLDTANIKMINYPSSKYRRIPNMLNLHSWEPLHFNISNTQNIDVKPGLTLLSQNMLSNTFVTLGYSYNNNLRTNGCYANISYSALYPVFDLNYEIQQRKYMIVNKTIRYHQPQLKFSVKAPINLTKSKYIRYIEPKIQLSLIGDTFASAKKVFKSVDYRLYATNYIKKCLRDIDNKWGQTFEINFSNMPFNKSDRNSLYTASIGLLYPGLFKHHSLSVYSSYQKKKNLNYEYNDITYYPTGYSDQFNEELWTERITYRLPLLYPDLKIGSLVYLKRIKGGIFYDYAEGINNGISKYYRSTGIEIRADINILRLLFPFDIGFRAYYNNKFTKPGFELIYSINLNEL